MPSLRSSIERIATRASGATSAGVGRSLRRPRWPLLARWAASRVYGDAAIHHAEHPVDPDRAVFNGNLRHLRHIGAERVVRGEPQMAARTPWPLAQPLSSNLDDIVQPGLVLGVAQPELHRIQPRLGGEFVHHRFLGGGRVGVPNRPPEGERQPVVDGHVAHFAVRGVVVLVQSLDAGMIHHPTVKRAVGEAHHPIDDAVARRPKPPPR